MNPTIEAGLEYLMQIQNPVGGIIFHHTDVDSLISIIETNEIRLTKYDCMKNDSKEGFYIKSVYQGVLRNLFRNKEIDRSYFEHIYDPNLNFKTLFLPSGKSLECTPYVSCFSQCNDFDTMKQYHGKHGGYLIFKADMTQFGKTEFPNASMDDTLLLKFHTVFYDKETIEKHIEQLVLKLKTYYYNGLEKEVLETIESCLSYQRLFIKSPIDNFGNQTSKEMEIRLIYYVPNKKYNIDKSQLPDFKYIDDDHIAIPIWNNMPGYNNVEIESQDEYVMKEIQSRLDYMNWYIVKGQRNGKTLFNANCLHPKIKEDMYFKQNE